MSQMKILVNVFVPAISERYDILVPKTIKIKNAVSMIAGAVENLSGQQYVSSGEEELCSGEKNIVLRKTATLEQYGIRNGDHLILM